MTNIHEVHLTDTHVTATDSLGLSLTFELVDKFPCGYIVR